MVTPIIKASKGGQTKSFYTDSTFRSWYGNGQSGWKIKYYKGLGTSTKAEAKEYFGDKNSFKDYVLDSKKQCDKAFILAFDKSKADKRKKWLESYDEQETLDLTQSEISYTDSIRKELIHFSYYDLQRSIPSLMDGLKPSLRKILYAAFKRNLTKEIKVAQFAGYIGEHTGYHHGEASLMGAIIGMAQNYLGANNINLFVPSGQFGTRLLGGKDHSSPRYIFTQLGSLTKLLFPSDDFPLLDYLDDDGYQIEPRYYTPIIPMILINGADGIGTGYSTKIPSYNPLEIVANMRLMLNGEKPKSMSPWYRGFNGTISADAKSKQKFTVSGKWKRLTDTKIKISELPVGTWITPYDEFLESLVIDKKVAKGKEAEAAKKKQFLADVSKPDLGHDDENVCFYLTFPTKKSLDDLIAEKDPTKTLEKQLKLVSNINLTNMHLFDADGIITKYPSVESIMKAFFERRLPYYNLRKEHLLKMLQQVADKLSAQAKFILKFIKNPEKFTNKPKSIWISYFEKHGYYQLGNENPYSYLTGMAIHTFTEEKIQALLQERDNALERLDELKNKTHRQLWLSDLEVFEIEYVKWLKQFEDLISSNKVVDSDDYRYKDIPLKKKRSSVATMKSTKSSKSKSAPKKGKVIEMDV